MPIRNPFRRTPGAEAVDEAAPKTVNDAATKPLQTKEPTEYKLSGMFCTTCAMRPRLCVETLTIL